MKYLLSAKSIKANDDYTVSTGIDGQELISRAAAAVLDALQMGGYDLSVPCILCGSGNNGADGFALAQMLVQNGSNACTVYLGKLYEPTPEPKKKKKNPPEVPAIDPDLIGKPNPEAMSDACRARYEQALAAGIPVLTELPDFASVYVDAVIGTGMHGAIQCARMIDAFDKVNAAGVPVVAVDVPSGLNSDTGAVDAHTLRANETVTVQSLKTGLVLYPGAELAGKVTVADIGIEAAPDFAPDALVLEDTDAAALIPARPTRSCKGTFGRVLVVCGTPGMAGAAYLAAMGAYRAGAGLVEILTHAQNRVVLQQLIPEAVITTYFGKKGLGKTVKTAVAGADAVVVGCGLGQSKLAGKVLKTVLKTAKIPCVVDADALNMIASKPALLKSVNKKQKPQVIITPHVGEAARLLGKKTTVDTVLADLYTAAGALYDKFGTTVVLKDARTLICTADGEYYVNATGSTALATAGSGDVLAGVIGGTLAAKTRTATPGQTAALGVYLHGKAGEKATEAVGERAAMARDILDGLTESYKKD